MTAIAFEVQPKSNTKYFAVSEFDGGIPSAYLKMIMFMSTLWKYSTNCKCNISRDSFGFPSYQYNLIRMFPFRSIREYVSKEREKSKGKKSEAVLCWCKFWHFQETELDVVFFAPLDSYETIFFSLDLVFFLLSIQQLSICVVLVIFENQGYDDASRLATLLLKINWKMTARFCVCAKHLQFCVSIIINREMHVLDSAAVSLFLSPPPHPLCLSVLVRRNFKCYYYGNDIQK